ncbi:DUF4258 domain-containing protein [Alkalicaulis satelles]|uniref:DUF4258 domain-containing protein n=1 Tax=Alkalicaulis satelles TaxID=2609175 RepID=A0A5M6ZNA8_9PROT|nr:DUF4258 domain-containing protein [Alkalicaulis satelles]
MKLRLTAHAAERIGARGISTDQIKAALTDPDWTTPDPEDPVLVRYYKAMPVPDGRVLRVVARRESGEHAIVTAFFDRGARRGRSE